jgi:hypothetical protein
MESWLAAALIWHAEWARSIAFCIKKHWVLIQAAAARLLKAPQRTADDQHQAEGERTFFVQIRTVRFLIIYSFWRQETAKKGAFIPTARIAPLPVRHKETSSISCGEIKPDARKRS